MKTSKSNIFDLEEFFLKTLVENIIAQHGMIHKIIQYIMTQNLVNERKADMIQPLSTTSILSGGVISENFGGHELLETACIKPWLLHRHCVLKKSKI